MRPVDDLGLSVHEILRLLGPLAALLTDKPNKPKHGKRGKQSASPPPWNSEAAGVWMEIHAGARHMERELCILIGLPVRSRGGSDQNTIYALERLPVLAGRDDGRSWQVVSAVAEAARWVRHTQALLDIKELSRTLPKAPGHDAPVCPYCHLDTLRWDRPRTRVFCSNPTCRDGEGRRPVAGLRGGVVSGTESMVFLDGMMLPEGLPKPRQEA